MDPFCLEAIDIFSNILYVMDKKNELAYLAHHASSVDRYRTETCCILGNFYSLKGQHQKAISYFQRALKLNPDYLAAWTLMGHEMVELRDIEGAVSSYKRAVDIDPRDYRAWYGLGQSYEIQQMFSYSLFYFKKAASLKPSDPRMWCAIGEAYERMDENKLAIQCFEKACSLDDTEDMALYRLAKLLQNAGESEKAEACFRKLIECESQDHLAEALLFLASEYLHRREYETAEQYCQELLDSGDEALHHQAIALLKQIPLARAQ